MTVAMMLENATSNPAIGQPAERSDAALPKRRVRSFVLRQGRLTAAQRQALETLWPSYGLPSDQPFDAGTVFGRTAPVVVEIGFGDGEVLAQMAATDPDTNYLGIEVHRPGIGHLLLRLQALGLSNVRIYCADAVDILTHNIANHSLDAINLFFPDPWPKKRHHKRRLVTPDFIRLVAAKLKAGGTFHAATDWEDYALQMLKVLQGCQELENIGAGTTPFAAPGIHRPRTKFELRGERLGHSVWELVFRRR